MDELKNGMAEAIGNFFSMFFGELQNVMNLAQALPDGSDGLATDFPAATLWTSATNVSIKAVAPVALTIIALFLALELISIFERVENKGLESLYQILMTCLKMAIAIALCKNMTSIIGACFQLTGTIVSNASKLITAETIKTTEFAKGLTDYYKGEDFQFWDLIGPYFVAFLCNSLSKIAFILAGIVCKLRFIEIYTFTAVAPIPFSTFVNREYKNIGVSFLKRLLALGVQGVFIMVVCYLYISIVNGSLDNISINGDPMGAMWAMAGYSIILIIAVFQTGGWAKSLLQVN